MFKQILNSLSRRERQVFIGAISIFLISSVFWMALILENKISFLPKKGGQFREGIIGQPIFINPIISNNEADRDISSLIYSDLLSLSNDYQIEKETNYLVKLKQDLVWDDGRPLTSDDVIFTVKTIQDSDVYSPLAQTWQGVVVERISELQIRFILRNPYIFFPDNLQNLPIIPQHIFGKIPAANLKLSSYNLEPVGSGPYKFESLSKEKSGFISQYKLTVNENYLGQKPYIEKFIFNFYENADDLIKAFNQRKIDGFGGLSSKQLEKISLNRNIKSLIMSNYYSIFFNQNINPDLKNQNVRLALAQAIDKKRIIQEVFGGEAIEIIQKINLSSSEKLPEEIELDFIVPQIDFLIKTAEIIKDNWTNLGVKINFIVLSPNDIVNQVIRSRDYELLLFGLNPQNSEDLFSFWHSSQKFHPGLNLAIYGNPNTDKLIEEIRQTADPDERKIKLENLQNIINQDLPAIFLYSPKYFYVSTKKLEGFDEKYLHTTSDRFQNVENWYVKKTWVLK